MHDYTALQDTIERVLALVYNDGNTPFPFKKLGTFDVLWRDNNGEWRRTRFSLEEGKYGKFQVNWLSGMDMPDPKDDPEALDGCGCTVDIHTDKIAMHYIASLYSHNGANDMFLQGVRAQAWAWVDLKHFPEQATRFLEFCNGIRGDDQFKDRFASARSANNTMIIPAIFLQLEGKKNEEAKVKAFAEFPALTKTVWKVERIP